MVAVQSKLIFDGAYLVPQFPDRWGGEAIQIQKTPVMFGKSLENLLGLFDVLSEDTKSKSRLDVAELPRPLLIERAMECNTSLTIMERWDKQLLFVTSD